MAQLNYYTYLSQATSLIIIYLIYYYINKQIIIPGIVEKIKIKNYISNKIINNKPSQLLYSNINNINLKYYNKIN